MAALGDLTIVVEARDPSGSLITAAFAADLGRPVAVVPGRVTTGAATGPNRLLREGAVPVRGAQDVLDELFGAGARTAAPPPAARADQLDPTLRRALEAVEAGEGADGVASAAGLDASRARAALGRLELMGLVVRDGLGGWERAGV
jgi:DNA processing protein